MLQGRLATETEHEGERTLVCWRDNLTVVKKGGSGSTSIPPASGYMSKMDGTVVLVQPVTNLV